MTGSTPTETEVEETIRQLICTTLTCLRYNYTDSRKYFERLDSSARIQHYLAFTGGVPCWDLAYQSKKTFTKG